MGLFADTFRQLADSLKEEAKVIDPLTKARIEEAHAKSRVTLSSKAQRRYAAAFAQPATTPEGAAKLDIGPVACLVQLYRYEKRGLVERLPEKKPTGQGASAILWQWKGAIEYSKEQISHV